MAGAHVASHRRLRQGLTHYTTSSPKMQGVSITMDAITLLAGDIGTKMDECGNIYTVVRDGYKDPEQPTVDLVEAYQSILRELGCSVKVDCGTLIDPETGEYKTVVMHDIRRAHPYFHKQIGYELYHHNTIRMAGGGMPPDTEWPPAPTMERI